jgi:hypothetical protein
MENAEHGFPTDLERNENTCDFKGMPYISNCKFDGVGSMFKHILPGQVNERKMDWQSSGKLM